MKSLKLPFALLAVFAGLAFAQAQPRAQEPSPLATQTAQTSQTTPATSDAIDILLSARTVAPVGDVGWREDLWLWGGPSPDKSEKRLQQELRKWGRFQVVSDVAEADLIVLLLEGTRQAGGIIGALGSSPRAYAQLIIFKGGQMPKKFEKPLWQADEDAGMFSTSAAGKVVTRFRKHIEELAKANPGRQQLTMLPSSKKAASTSVATAPAAAPVGATASGNPSGQPQAALTPSVSPPTGTSAEVSRTKVDAHHDTLTALALPPNGNIFASAAGSDKTIKLWSLPGGRLLAKLSGHKSGVDTLALTPDGKMLVSGSQDHTIRLWSLPEGRALATLEGHQKYVNTLVVTPDGKMLASGSEDHTIRLWSLPEGRPLAALEGALGRTGTLAVTPDGKVLISGGKDVRLWSLPEGRALATLSEGNPRASAYAAEDLALTPDGKTLISAHDDGSVKLWSLPGGQPLATLREHRGAVASVAVAPDGKVFASGAEDDSVLLWSLPEGRLLASLVGHSGAPAILAFAPNGKMLVTGQKYYILSLTQTSNTTVTVQTHGNAGIVMLWNLERMRNAKTVAIMITAPRAKASFWQKMQGSAASKENIAAIVQQELSAWNRFTLVDDPRRADLVFAAYQWNVAYSSTRNTVGDMIEVYEGGAALDRDEPPLWTSGAFIKSMKEEVQDIRNEIERDPKQIQPVSNPNSKNLKNPDWKPDKVNLDLLIGDTRRDLRKNWADPGLHNRVGVALTWKGHLNSAGYEFRQALLLKPDYHNAHAHLAGILALLGDINGAIMHSWQAVRLEPANTVDQGLLSALLERKGHRIGSAGETHQPNLAAKDWEYHAILAHALLENGNLDDAVSEYREAVERSPVAPHPHDDLGCALLLKGEHDAAIAEFQQATKIEPGYAWGYFNLGRALQAKGDLSGALVAFNQAYTLEPNNPEFKAKLEEIK